MANAPSAIGCYFDDVCHELLGLTGKTFQSLYHFTVGSPLLDERISSHPPYPHRNNKQNCQEKI